MANKSNINYEGFLNKARAVFAKEFEDDKPFLADFDGDQRILVHAVFYIATKSLNKKIQADNIFAVLRKFQEAMLRTFIIDPNSDKVDELLEKCDIIFQTTPYIATKECEEDSDYMEETVLVQFFGWMTSSISFVWECSDDQLDDLLDDLSLKMGAPGSRLIEAYLPEMRQEVLVNGQAMLNGDLGSYDDDDEICEDGPTIAVLRNMEIERQILVLKLLEVSGASLEDMIKGGEMSCFNDDIRCAITSFEEGEDTVSDDIDDAIDSLNDLLAYMCSEDFPDDLNTKIGSTLLTGMLKIFIDNIDDLPEDDFNELWESVRDDDAFNDDKVIELSKKLTEAHFPKLLDDYINSSNPHIPDTDI